MTQIVVRNCPSPTGLLHIGTLRTALYNFLFAKKHQGKIVFRSEDTDKERSKPEYEENIISGLVKMGMLETNTPIIKQSNRTEIYKKYLQQLLDENKAYYCFMTPAELEAEREDQKFRGLAPRYSGKYRDYPKDEALARLKNGEKAVIRLKTPLNQDIIFSDLIRGENKTNSKELADFVIAKDLDNPLYNFCVVIDDHEMAVTHVIRGEDHIPNTPKQILIYQAFGWDLPAFAHLPLILNEDRSKLSKRKNKVSVDDYLAEGYLPEALINFLVLIGWNPGTETEIFSLPDLITEFSLERVHKGGAIFDLKKLDWMNGVYIRQLNIDNLCERLKPYLKQTLFYSEIEKLGEDYLKKVVLSVQAKLKKLAEINELIKFYYVKPVFNANLLINTKMKVDETIAKKAIEEAVLIFEKIDENNFTIEEMKTRLTDKIQVLNWSNGQMLWPIRAALTGAEFSPGAFEVAEILGLKESLSRLDFFKNAIQS